MELIRGDIVEAVVEKSPNGVIFDRAAGWFAQAIKLFAKEDLLKMFLENFAPEEIKCAKEALVKVIKENQTALAEDRDVKKFLTCKTGVNMTKNKANDVFGMTMPVFLLLSEDLVDLPSITPTEQDVDLKAQFGQQ